MTSPSRQFVSVLLPAVVGALLVLGWFYQGRRERVEHVSSLGAESAAPDPTTATGWAGNRRWLIASEHNNDSYQWIMETQQMLATGEWRLRQVTYDNAQDARAVGSPSPYRWWLAASAKLQQLVRDGSTPLAVERATLFADPLLLALAVPAIAFGILLGVDALLAALALRLLGDWILAVVCVLLVNAGLLALTLVLLRGWWQSLSLPRSRAALARVIESLK